MINQKIFEVIKNRKILNSMWLALLVAMVGMMIFPVRLGAIRLGIVLSFITLLAGGYFLFWKNKYIRYILVVISITIIMILIMPGNKPDIDLLQKTNIKVLLSYENIRYIWGGENKLGIDCSGLVREGYAEANFEVGIKTLNTKLIRRAFFIWWNDCAADSLGNGYKGMTKLVMKADSMDKLDYNKIMAGDIIVVDAGFHTFVYIGDHMWLEADPMKGKVLKVSSEDKAKEWVGVPIKIVRWN